MKSGSIRLIALAVLALAGSASFGASDKKEADAQLLDQGEYACSNCFFGPTTYFFCFKADNRILIARDRIPTFNWRDPNQNYLAKYHKDWKTWQAPGGTVKIQYDNKHVWVPRGDGKEVRMALDNTQDIFLNSTECRAAVKKPAPKWYNGVPK